MRTAHALHHPVSVQTYPWLSSPLLRYVLYIIYLSIYLSIYESIYLFIYLLVSMSEDFHSCLILCKVVPDDFSLPLVRWSKGRWLASCEQLVRAHFQSLLLVSSDVLCRSSRIPFIRQRTAVWGCGLMSYEKNWEDEDLTSRAGFVKVSRWRGQVWRYSNQWLDQ